jgi:hypothetical protein
LYFRFSRYCGPIHRFELTCSSQTGGLSHGVYVCVLEVTAMIRNRAILASVFAAILLTSTAEDKPPVGTWRGASKCATDAVSCHDEDVVYYISVVPHRSDQLSIRADKIVNGIAVTMGTGTWAYDPKKQTLSLDSNGRLWLLTVRGNHIDGTLEVNGTTIFRQMELTLDPTAGPAGGIR